MKRTLFLGYFLSWCFVRKIMNDLLIIRINQMQDVVKKIMTEHDLDIVSLGNYITEALKEINCKYTFKLINLEDKSN